MVRPDQVREFGLGVRRGASGPPAAGVGADRPGLAEFIEGEPAPNLNTLTVSQLRGYAEDRGIDLGRATRKADIIRAIEGAS